MNMQSTEGYEPNIEHEGCCEKLRDKRAIVTISLLLASAIVTVSGGLYYGIITKNYSNVTIAVGIYFPSIVLAIICVYIVVTCIRDSSASSRIRCVARDVQLYNCDVTQHPERNHETLINPQAEVNRHSGTSLQRNRANVAKPERICDVPVNASVYSKTKDKGRHFRSFSNSDVTKYRCTNDKMFCSEWEKEERGKENIAEDSTRPQKIAKFIPSKRSLSDAGYNYRNQKSREKISIANSKSLKSLRKRQHSVSDEEDNQHTRRSFAEATRVKSNPIGYASGNNEYSKSYEAEMEWDYYMTENKSDSYKTKNEVCPVKSSLESAKKEYVTDLFVKLEKPHIKRFHSSNLMDYSHKEIKYLGNVQDHSSSENQQNDSSFRNNSEKLKFHKDGARNYVSLLLDVDRVKRKAIYFPDPNNRQGTSQLSRTDRENSRMAKDRTSSKDKENTKVHLTSELCSMKYPLVSNVRSESVGYMTVKAGDCTVRNKPIHSILKENALQKMCNLKKTFSPDHRKTNIPND